MSSLLFMDRTLLERGPRVVTPELRSLVEPLGFEEPRHVPVVRQPGAEAGWCHRNVANVVAREGGEAAYGVCIWANDLFATAEFHAVHRRSDGTLTDPTPKPDGDRDILFALDPSRGPDFDFMQRPANRRVRLYRGLSAERRAVDLIACMSLAQIRSEARRAEKAGMSLEKFVASRTRPDGLELAIDRFLACCAESEAMLKPTPEGQWCDDIPRWRTLETRKAELLGRLCRIWRTHPERARLAQTREAAENADTGRH
ncbi:MAG: hypothetical protein QHD01_16865 [Bradyrhizobium sp.]|uniref:hypothetical protein n=1 Tax=Bradyrhizobium sp. TaxID=376 RepID=UPI0029BE4F29|nr:hypothetical protein [Bradyrhizobium sp.]MDX3968257.1 hypothetical protein [Bradyrhizobium sp.]